MASASWRSARDRPGTRPPLNFVRMLALDTTTCTLWAMSVSTAVLASGCTGAGSGRYAMRPTSGMPRRLRPHLRERVAKKMRELGVRKDTHLPAPVPKWLRMMMMMLIMMMMMVVAVVVMVMVMGGDDDRPFPWKLW